jgi:hypothetical protein
VDVDTYWNHNLDDEMKENHIFVSSDKNGEFGSGAPVAYVENGIFHPFRVTWNKDDGVLTVYLDNVVVVTTIVPSIADQFTAGTSTAYFGFTATTGGHTNTQKICNIVIPEGSVTAPEIGSETILCENFAVHGTTAITFGANNKVDNGDVGSYTAAAITETAYVLEAGFTQYDENAALTKECAEAKVAAAWLL